MVVLSMNVTRRSGASGAILTDDNGLPRGHNAAIAAAARELADVINEMPDGFYHMVPADCDLAAERVIVRYMYVLKTQNAAATD